MFIEHSHNLSIAPKTHEVPPDPNTKKGGRGALYVVFLRLLSPAAPALPVSFLGERQV